MKKYNVTLCYNDTQSIHYDNIQMELVLALLNIPTVNGFKIQEYIISICDEKVQ